MRGGRAAGGWLAALLAGALAGAACGKYGPPERVPSAPAAGQQSALTEPAPDDSEESQPEPQEAQP